MNREVNQPTPQNIMQIGTSFWVSKVLLTAVKFELFTLLATKKSMSGVEIKKALGFKCSDRHTYDFLDVLTGLNLLQRQGLLDDALYSNSTDTDIFLDKNKPSYIGGILEMANDRLFRFWADLDEALLTGKPQNELKNGGASMFEALYSDPARLKQFINAMSGVSVGNFIALATKFDFSPYKTLCDIGGAAGILSLQIAKHNPHMKCTSLDLPPVEPIARETIASHGLSDRVKTGVIDFFADEFPKADVITMGMILHDWDLENKKMLIKKAYNALPDGGAFIAIEAIIDNERKHNVFGLSMSLNMLVEFGVAFDFTGDDFTSWVKEAGFKRVDIVPLAGPSSAAIAIK
jgi:predicted O-methyltransferase YrrM